MFDNSTNSSSQSQTTLLRHSSGILGSFDSSTYHFPVTIDLEKVGYNLPPANGSKRVLNDISARFSPGNLTAIMGPSGAGKTTLLNVIGNYARGSIEGTIKVNGRIGFPPAFKSIKCHIPQDDILLSSLSPRETLMYVARLRLPDSVSLDRKSELVERLLDQLRLSECADTKVGNVDDRGISGGQRKRVSIGMELVINPSVMFVDEPSSGLDSKMAEDVVSILSRLAKQERTVICTIHQPSFNIFMNFDVAMMLTAGRIAFYGPTHQLTTYFTGIGFNPPSYENPCDYVMRLLQEVDKVPFFAQTWPEFERLHKEMYDHNKVMAGIGAEDSHASVVLAVGRLTSGGNRSSDVEQHGSASESGHVTAGGDSFSTISLNSGGGSNRGSLNEKNSSSKSAVWDNVSSYLATEQTHNNHHVYRDPVDDLMAGAGNADDPERHRHHHDSTATGASAVSSAAALAALSLIVNSSPSSSSSASSSATDGTLSGGNNISLQTVRRSSFRKQYQPMSEIAPPAGWEEFSMMKYNYPITRTKQFRILLERSLVDYLKDKRKFLAGLMLKISVGVMVGIVWLGQAGDTNKAIFPTSGALFLCVMSSVMDTLFATVMQFPAIRTLMAREYRNGSYCLAAFFLSQLLTRMLAQSIFGIFLFMPVFFLVGLHNTVTRFFLFVANVIVMACIGTSLGLAIGSSVDDFQGAQQSVMPTVVPLILFSGYVIPYDNIQYYFKWMYYCSFFQYSFSSMLITQFSGMKYDDCDVPELPPLPIFDNYTCPATCWQTGDDYLESNNMHPDDMTRNFTVLIAFFVGFCILGYYLVKYAMKNKYL